MSAYHIIFRPELKNLPTFERMKEYLETLSCMSNYCLGAEKGSSNGKEEYNHFDIVLVTTRDIRVDSLKRTICNYFQITDKNNLKNIKVYKIDLDDNDRLTYQLGYCIKEGIRFATSYSDQIMLTAEQNFEKLKKIFGNHAGNKKKGYYSINEIYKLFKDYVAESYGGERPPFSYCYSLLHDFWIMIEDDCEFTTWQRINTEKLCWCVSSGK